MPKLRRLSGDEVIAIFRRFGFEVQDQKGSHVKLRRLSPNGERQTLTIPRHQELDIGTLHAIFRQASPFVTVEQLRPHFYSE